MIRRSVWIWICTGYIIISCMFCGVVAQDTLWLSTGAVGPMPLSEAYSSRNWSADFSENFHEGIYYGYVNVPPGLTLPPSFSVQEYFPENWYSVLIFSPQDYASLQTAGIKGFHAPGTSDKIDPVLTGETLPYHLYTASSLIRLDVSVYDTSYWETYRETLLKKGFTIHAWIPSIRLVQLDIPEKDLEELAELPFVRYIQPIAAPPVPENDQSRTGQRGNLLNTVYPGGLKLDGKGVVVAINDDGDVRPHIDLKNRIDGSDVADTILINDHGDHIAGIVAGAGNRNPRLQGVAPGAFLKIYAYTDDPASGKGLFDFPNAYNNDSVRITTTSYSDGCNTGYTAFAQLLDQQTNTLPSLIHVFSAGNSGTTNCGYGAGAGWANITGGQKAAKNVLTIGNISKQDVLQPNSSRGPVHDGRIKPELVAVGTSVESTTSYPSDNLYTVKSGTSMSAPAVAGVLAQLYQGYKILYGSEPSSALIKAAVINTADDMGNPGPDYKNGYGRLNAYRAYQTLEENRFFAGMLTQGNNQSFNIAVPNGTTELRITLYWHDKPAAAGASIALVNNLNLTVVDPGVTTWLPWVLDATANPANLNANAFRAVDNRNNTEQVTIANPVAGSYQVNIAGTFIPQGPQEFYVVYETLTDEVMVTYPAGGESLIPGTVEKIRWDAHGSSGTFTLQYSSNGGGVWNTIANSITASTRYFDWTVPNILSGNTYIKVIRGAEEDVSDTAFSIIGVPNNLLIDTICGSEVMVHWDPVPGANGYDVFLLGALYMEQKGSTTATQFKLTGINTSVENWISVRATGPGNAVGRRCIAVSQPSLSLNCIINRNIELRKLVFPFEGDLPACMTSATEPVIVKIHNMGLQPTTSFQVSYSLNGNGPVTEIVNTVIAPGDSLTYTFSTTENLSTPGNYDVKAWVAMANDQYTFNDTQRVTFRVFSSIAASLPIFEDFETFPICPVTANCGGTQCNFNNGFHNLENGIRDGMDWRPHAGATPSPNTGPDKDFDPGTLSGIYIYIEASNCEQQFADFYLPCISLAGTTAPKLKFAYSMVGQNIGELSVDVYHQHGWTPVFSTQGEQQVPTWRTAIVDLGTFQNEDILIRFRGTTTTGFTADMGLDQIQVTDILSDMSFLQDTAICVDSSIVVTDNSTGVITSRFWDFGQDASPATSTLPGPHQVFYSTPGIKNISLTVSGPAGTNTSTRQAYVNDPPAAGFSYTLNVPQVSFTNNTTGGLAYFWNFGDGSFSTAFEPAHTYQFDGSYTVTLFVDNGCGIDSVKQTVLVVGIGVPTIPDPENVFNIYPNPFVDNLFISYHGTEESSFQIILEDLSGRSVYTGEFTFVNGGNYPIPVPDLVNGLYLLRIINPKKSIVAKIIRQE